MLGFKVSWLQVGVDSLGQRLDNFLIKTLKGVPRAKIYNIIRKGEVRVNSGRVKPTYKLKLGDQVRVPPVYKKVLFDKTGCLQLNFIDLVLYQDQDLLVVNKPAGVAVHSGSGHAVGLIDFLRSKLAASDSGYLELVHRLDKDTTGVLILAKNRATLLELQASWQVGKVSKRYLLLVDGEWSLPNDYELSAPIAVNRVNSRRVMQVAEHGKASVTRFQVVRRYQGYTLLFAWPITGRTHQIRVHAQYLGFPLVGDVLYNDKFENEVNVSLFLHASAVRIEQQNFVLSKGVVCPMPREKLHLLQQLSLASA